MSSGARSARAAGMGLRRSFVRPQGRGKLLKAQPCVRWLGVFAVLLFASSAGPVLADPAEAPPQAGAEVTLPDAQDVTRAIAMAEREEREREEELAMPAAVQEREESLEAFSGSDSPGAAATLLQATFVEQLETLDDDPARFLSDAKLVQPLGATAATVESEGDGQLMDGGMPVRTENDDGELRKVDLSLLPTSGGFETANALIDLEIGTSAAAGVQIGEGLSISQVGASQDSAAKRIGDDSVLYADVGADGDLADTDLLVAPIASGVELFSQLRSVESPETLRFHIDMPAGADLRPDGYGGAEVVMGEDRIAHIPSPYAVDAQGSEVEVEMETEGDILVLHVAHREEDVAYPLLVDPAIYEDWVNPGLRWIDGGGLGALTNGAWSYTETGSWILESTSCIYACWGGSGRGLFISMPSFQQWGQQFGHWYYSAPNAASYLANAWANPFVRHDHGCPSSSYFQPHDYVGMWAQGQWNRVLANQAISVGSVNIQSWGEAFILGLHTGGSNTSSYMPCWRDLYVGGAVVWLDDWSPPQVSASVSGVPSGWFSGTQQVTVGASAGDVGLGVRRVTLTTDGKGVIGEENVGCTGLHGSRCPTARSSQFKPTGASFAEGVRSSSVSAEDPTGKAAVGGYFQTKVDYGPPEVFLDGQLAEATGDDEGEAKGDAKTEKLRLPVYNLKVEAKDGSNASNTTRRSGVKNIEVFLDGVKQSVPWSAQSATEDSRPMTQTYQLKLSTVETAGLHKLEVKVGDQAENPPRVRSLEFQYFPATGMKDEYVMHYFPLPNGQGNEAEEEHPDRPELAVNVMNGNLVYREQDVEVEGPAVDLDVERYYNSQLPEAEDTEWGDGWTLAQTPDFEPFDTGGSPAPDKADVLDSSGAIEDGVQLPTEVGQKRFDPSLRATFVKRSGGGYEMIDETGESATSVAFDETGQTEALLTDGYAKVDYAYEGGALSGIAIDDPGSTSLSPEELEPLIEEGEGEPEEEDPAPSFAGQAASLGLPAMVDVAVDQAGNTWVLDRTYALVLKFNPTGQLLSYFGWEGTQAGKFKSPSGIAIDGEGFIWVADSGNNRIQKLAPNGEPMGWFGSYGSGEGEFIQPSDVAIDEEGNVWVADSGNSRLQKFGPWGEFLGAFGSPGGGDGEFLAPKALDVGPEGDIWVADTYNDRVQKISPEGEHLLTPEASIQQPEGIVVDAEGEAWVASASSHAIRHLGPDGEELGDFGSYGSGEGLWLKSPHGLTVDPQDRLFIADTANNRVVRWGIVPPASERLIVVMGSFGAEGSGEGEMSSPSSIAAASNGNVWVADTANSRIQRFDSHGEQQDTIGAEGSAPGEFSWPMGIATGPEGDAWVADTGNGRVQHFDAEGHHLGEFGTWGEGPGEFSNVVALATGSEGDLWTLDAGSYRVQHFDAEGNYLGQFGEYGSGNGQFISPSALAVADDGSVWVADTGNMRVQKFNPEGKYRRTLNLGGEEPMPTGVEIDGEGNVWVAEGYGERIRGFTSSGRPLGQFSSESSEYELSLPYDLAIGSGDDIWAVGLSNSRIQRFHAIESSTSTSVELPADDPSVEVETSNGLISALEGEEAGEHSYEHEGDFLVSHDGPNGETLYEKNAAGLLSKVTLPNGTWASIEYFVDNRVKSVTVKLAGEPSSKKTTFEYQDTPYQDSQQRRTIVDPPDAPYVTYEIGADGSVFKWWNKPQPPTFDFLAGTLWDHKEEENGLWAGDHLLEVQAFSAEGIASIQVIANGGQLVHETTCEQTEAQGIECVEPPLKSQWVANTDALAPGHLNIEVIATDHAGGSASERFWVDIPEPPPPLASGTPIPPKFADILQFRDEYGLEKVFPVANEIERNERIFNLIKAWYEGDPVARASADKWGVPLRLADVAELEYRAQSLAHNAPLISKWGETQESSTYAGFYMDHRAGGIIRVGSTAADQSSALQALISQGGLAATDRLGIFSLHPSWSLADLRSTSWDFDERVPTRPDVLTTMSEARLNIPANRVALGTTNVPLLSEFLTQYYGSTSALSAYFQPKKGILREESCYEEFHPRAREMNGRLYSGDWIRSMPGHCGCTLAFGAWTSRQGMQGQTIKNNFALTAGHCWGAGALVRRAGYRLNSEGKRVEETTDPIGTVLRRSNGQLHAGFETDSEAIDLRTGVEVPRWVYWNEGFQSKINGAEDWIPGMTLCLSGSYGRSHCGPTEPELLKMYYEGEGNAPTWQIVLRAYSECGDSGGPIWNPQTGAAVALLTGGPGCETGPTWVTPLLSLEGKSYTPEVGPGTAPGALAAPEMIGPPAMHIVDGVN